MPSVTPYRRPYWDTQPEYLFPKYASTVKRAPTQPLVVLPHTLSEVTAPVFGYDEVKPGDADLTKQHKGEPLGERIVVSGRVLDENGKPIANILVEIWQANAAGRYNHRVDQHDAPIDPNFTGAGRFLTDKNGHYRFMTIRPGEYPWRNHYNAWRPAHIHFSLLGRAFAQRLVTQMYFPGDPFFPYDPIFNSVRDPKARDRMVSSFSIHDTVPNWAQAFQFDIYLRGPGATPFEEEH